MPWRGTWAGALRMIPRLRASQLAIGLRDRPKHLSLLGIYAVQCRVHLTPGLFEDGGTSGWACCTGLEGGSLVGHGAGGQPGRLQMLHSHSPAGGGLGRHDRRSHCGSRSADGRGNGPDYLRVVLLHHAQRRKTLSGYGQLRQYLLAPPPNHRQDVYSQGMGARRLRLRKRVDAGGQKLIDALGQKGVLPQRLHFSAEGGFLLHDRGAVLLQQKPTFVELIENLLQSRLRFGEALEVAIELADLVL